VTPYYWDWDAAVPLTRKNNFSFFPAQKASELFSLLFDPIQEGFIRLFKKRKGNGDFIVLIFRVREIFAGAVGDCFPVIPGIWACQQAGWPMLSLRKLHSGCVSLCA